MNATSDLLQDAAERDSRSSDPFRLLVEAWPGVVVIFDADGFPTWLNVAAQRLPIGSVTHDFRHSPLALAAWERALEGLPPIEPVAVHLADARGVPRLLNLRFVPFSEERGERQIACLLSVRHSAEERLETALEIARSGAWEMHVPSGRVWYSEGYYRLCGADIDIARATPDFWRTRVHPDDYSSVMSAFQDYAQGRTATFETEYRMRHEDGSWLWLLDRSRTVERDLRGLPVRVIGFLMDITKRRAAEQALRDSENAARKAELALQESRLVMQTIIASSATHLALFDRDHRCVFANYTLHGGPLSDVIGHRIYDFMPKEYHEEIRLNFDKVLRTGEGMDSENEMHLEGRDPFLIEMRLRPVKSEGEVVGIVTNIVDVSELHRQREHLRVQVRIIETIRDGVALLDRTGRILIANPALHTLFRHAPESLAGRHFRDLSTLSPAAVDRLLERVSEELQVAESSQTEFEGVCANGEKLVAACIFASIELRGERHVVAVLSDITERKRLEREMLLVATREQQRIGSDLHDGLGQQLTGIALLLKGLVPRLSRSKSAVSKDDVERIVALVNEAIDSTRSLARGLSPVPATGDGLPLALEALARQTRELHRVDVSLENALPEGLAFDDNTATHLYRIAQEGLGNALRHGQPSSIRLTLRAHEGQVELVIVDDGVGFDRRVLQTAGGLGLKIMRFRAQMIGGDVNIESAPGFGTTIRCHCAAPRVPR
ncbi:MAG: PAS domain-containing protein [Steroidobacteraceae bacterium]